MQTFVERHSAAALLDNLLDAEDAWPPPLDVVQRVVRLIEAGHVEVTERSVTSVFQVYTQEAEADLTELVGPEAASDIEIEPEEDVSEPDPDPAAPAQVSVLLAAAVAGTPFCEVCR